MCSSVTWAPSQVPSSVLAPPLPPSDALLAARSMSVVSLCSESPIERGSLCPERVSLPVQPWSPRSKGVGCNSQGRNSSWNFIGGPSSITTTYWVILELTPRHRVLNYEGWSLCPENAGTGIFWPQHWNDSWRSGSCLRKTGREVGQVRPFPSQAGRTLQPEQWHNRSLT